MSASENQVRNVERQNAEKLRNVGIHPTPPDSPHAGNIQESKFG
jgi:hypothetical protein